MGGTRRSDTGGLNFPCVSWRVVAMRSIDAFNVISTEETERRFAVSEHVAYDYADITLVLFRARIGIRRDVLA